MSAIGFAAPLFSPEDEADQLRKTELLRIGEKSG